MQFNLLSVGQKQANSGQAIDVSPSLLQEIVESFQESKGRFLPPVIEGHQGGDDRERGEGIDALIRNLEFDGQFLKGEFGQIQDRFWEAVKGEGGNFTPYLSSRILPPDHPYNPNPGKWSLGHVARVGLPGDPQLGYLFNQKQEDGSILAPNYPLDFAEEGQKEGSNEDPGDRIEDDTTIAINMPTEYQQQEQNSQQQQEEKQDEGQQQQSQSADLSSLMEKVNNLLQQQEQQQQKLLDRISKLEENAAQPITDSKHEQQQQQQEQKEEAEAPDFSQLQDQIETQNRAIWSMRLSPYFQSQDRLNKEINYLSGLNKAAKNGIDFGQDPVESRIQELIEFNQGVRLGEPESPAVDKETQQEKSPLEKAREEARKKYEEKK
jgi:hypothetical protein